MFIEKYMFECIYMHTRKTKDYNVVKKKRIFTVTFLYVSYLKVGISNFV